MAAYNINNKSGSVISSYSGMGCMNNFFVVDKLITDSSPKHYHLCCEIFKVGCATVLGDKLKASNG